jgi:hypothetical protein
MCKKTKAKLARKIRSSQRESLKSASAEKSFCLRRKREKDGAAAEALLSLERQFQRKAARDLL